MKKLSIPEPISVGLFLSYRCSSGCKHCMYASSSRWSANWISKEDAQKILTLLASKIQNPFGPSRIGINYGLHFTGGEPFLNFNLLLNVTKIAHELEISPTFVETNCYWCTNNEITRDKLMQLKDVGLDGILISVNPFILEHVPFERTERAARISREVFGWNVIPYQEYFYRRFKDFNLKGTLPFEEYLKIDPYFYENVELFLRGRAPYKLGYLFRKHFASRFFNVSCKESLLRNWHVHIDNYGNYIAGYCGGISLGNVRNSDLLYEGIDLDEYPVLDTLINENLGKLYKFAKKFGYRDQEGGYVSKCHLCVDMRKHLVKQADFKELNPKEFYLHLE